MPSYSPVFSQDFINYTEAAPVTEFEVPSGFTAVVRDIQVTALIALTGFGFYKQNSPDAPLVPFVFAEIGGSLTFFQWSGRVVIPAGGTLSMNQTTLGVQGAAYAGGYLLRNNLT